MNPVRQPGEPDVDEIIKLARQLAADAKKARTTFLNLFYELRMSYPPSVLGPRLIADEAHLSDALDKAKVVSKIAFEDVRALVLGEDKGKEDQNGESGSEPADGGPVD